MGSLTQMQNKFYLLFAKVPNANQNHWITTPQYTKTPAQGRGKMESKVLSTLT